MIVVGLDVGGANLKLADSRRRAASIPFPLWQQEAQLAAAVFRELQRFSPFDVIALTMTGELADCYQSKLEGISRIIDAVVRAAGDIPVWVWQTSGEFVPPEVAWEFPRLTAAANWHALASWVARCTLPDTTALLLDCGSTTTDIIPLSHGVPCPRGWTDFERLASGELVYTGGERTPLCAVVSRVSCAGINVPVAAELFATMLDVYLLTDQIAERQDCSGTADGRPADKLHAARRLARMVCRDAGELDARDWRLLAQQLAQAQQATIREALHQVLDNMQAPPRQLIYSGSSAFVVSQVVASVPSLAELPAIRLRENLGEDVASAACAYALVQLAQERLS